MSLNRMDKPMNEDKTFEKVSLMSIFAGLAYGIVFRLMLQGSDAVMFMTGLFVLPFLLGAASVYIQGQASWWRTAGTSVLSGTLFLLFTFIVGWEGLICLIIILPMFLPLSVLGGFAMKVIQNINDTSRFNGFILCSLFVVPVGGVLVEKQVETPTTFRIVENVIEINAPVETVWKNIIRVPEISEEEHSSSPTQLMGFPRPVEATLSHEGVGEVRHASFENGILFIETITDWQHHKTLSFSIEVDPDAIPETTLDPHVTIGGAYFDVLTGTYRIEEKENGKLLLHLSSRQRVSTNFNFYTTLWTEFIMSDIQQYILEIIKKRCEEASTLNQQSSTNQPI